MSFHRGYLVSTPIHIASTLGQSRFYDSSASQTSVSLHTMAVVVCERMLLRENVSSVITLKIPNNSE